MDVFSLIVAAKGAYKYYDLANRIFVNRTKDLLSQVAELDLQSAVRSLSDVAYSQNPKNEMYNTIALLKLSMDKYDVGNEHKFKVALIIAFCYYCVGDLALSMQYKELSIQYFNCWADMYQEVCIEIFSKRALKNIDTEVMCSKDFKRKFGIEWEGPEPVNLFSRLLSVFEEKSYNEKFREGILSAKKQYRQRANNVF